MSRNKEKKFFFGLITTFLFPRKANRKTRLGSWKLFPLSNIFWSMERSTGERRKFIQDNIAQLLSADGRTGRIRELIESSHPVILLTHWQSLYTQGTGLGLEGLNELAGRIRKVFGNSMEWVSCSERARRFVNG